MVKYQIAFIREYNLSDNNLCDNKLETTVFSLYITTVAIFFVLVVLLLDSNCHKEYITWIQTHRNNKKRFTIRINSTCDI